MHLVATEARSRCLRLFSKQFRKGNSRKLVCRMLHSLAPWPRYGRPETSRLLKVDHYKLHVRIIMRLGGCVAFSQITDADTGVGVLRC